MTVNGRKFPVLGSQLRAARESLALSLEEVAAELGVETGEVAGWEDGSREPSVEQVADLAELYGRNVDYFLVSTPPRPERLHFRLKKRNAMTALPHEVRTVIARFEELCRAAEELEELIGKGRAVTVRKWPKEADPNALAVKERERLGLAERPVKDLRTVVEGQGVRVFELPVPEGEFAGLSWWHEQYGPCVLVNARDVPGRRSFTLAHEYGHILQPGAAFICDLSLDYGEERFANKFAAAFLMPARDVRETFLSRGLYGTTPSMAELGSLARRYAVSMEALCRRLEELQLVAAGTANSLVAQWEAAPKHPRRPKTPPWRRQLGEGYVSAALQLRAEGRISAGKLAQYLGIDVRSAMAVAEESKGEKQGKD